MFRKGFFVSVGLALSVAVAAAQTDTCPPLIQTALEQVGDSCGSLTRNTVCYGNISLEAEAQSDVTDFTFADVGDTVNLVDLATLETSPLDEEANTWGVAVLSVQANLPDTLPGQNVTMMVYGDSTLQPQISIRLNVDATQTVNIRQTPTTEGAVIGQLQSGAPVQADGRLEDNSWVRVVLEDGTIGWVNTGVATVEGDVASLPVLAADDTTASSQSAFYFTSGIGESACAELPSGGILLQSPEGTEVELVINDVSIEIGSTIAVRFLDQVPNPDEDDPLLPHLAFYVLEGSIQNVGLTGPNARPVALPTVQEGLVLYVPVDEATGLPNGQDPLVKPYNGDDIAILGTLTTALPVEITPAEPMSEEAFAELQAITIQAGEWTFAPSGQPVICLDDSTVQDVASLMPEVSQALSGSIRVLEDGEAVETVDPEGEPTEVTGKTDGDIIVLESSMPTYALTRSAPDVYSGTTGFGALDLKLVSPTQGVLRAVTPILSSTGEQYCAEAEVFLIGVAAE